MVPSTRSTGYRCSLPGLAGFACVPSPGTAPYVSQNGAEVHSGIDSLAFATIDLPAVWC